MCPGRESQRVLIDPWALYSLRKGIQEYMWHFSEKCPLWPTQNFLCLNEQTLDALQIGPHEELCLRCSVLHAQAISANRNIKLDPQVPK
jgi:hypothetical protein